MITMDRGPERGAEGFGAQKVVLLALEGKSRRRAVAHEGLADYEVIACEAGNSVPGVSTSRRALAAINRSRVL